MFADDPYLAEDAADLVEVDIEELPPLLRCRSRRPANSRRGGAPSPRSCARTTAMSTRRFAPRTPSSHSISPVGRHSGRSAGDPRRDRAAMTPRATCWNSTAPPRCRTGTATRSPACSAAAPASVHLHEGHVGGGFGIRGELYPEDVLVCVAALRLRPPGEMDRGPARASDRRQSFAPAAHHVRAAVDADGRILADRRRVLSRPGRLCAHPRRDRAGSRRRHAARPLSGAGLSGCRPYPPDQQDAVRQPIGRPAASRARSCASG